MKALTRYELASTDTFRVEARKAGGLVLPVRKEFVGVEVKESDGGLIEFCISTAAPDRSNDTVSVDGWDVANFMANPVVLFAHDYGQPPVGKATTVYPADGRMMAKAEFTPRDLYEFGWMIGEMYRRGFLSAVSVGFKPKSYNFNAETGGVDFAEQELLEFSAVPIPANPEALIAAKSAGLPTIGLVEWAERILDESQNQPTKGLLVPREYVERMRATLKAPSVSVPADVPADGDSGDDVLVDALEALTKAVKKLTKRLDAIEAKAVAPTTLQVGGPASGGIQLAQPAPRKDVAQSVADEVRKQLSTLLGRNLQ